MITHAQPQDEPAAPWQPLASVPLDTPVLLGAWYRDDCDGYFGPSCWKWIASGNVGSTDDVWVDHSDSILGNIKELVGFDKPTHWTHIL